MSDDIREDVAQAILDSRYATQIGGFAESLNTYGGFRSPRVIDIHSKYGWMETAEAAISAAEPHLRRKHRQELLDELIADITTIPNHCWGIVSTSKVFSDYIEAWKESEE